MSNSGEEKITEIIGDYLNYLRERDPLLFNNMSFFRRVFRVEEEIKLPFFKGDNYQEISATNSMRLVKDFFELYHKHEWLLIEKAFSKGMFNIFYVDENMEKEDNVLYDKKDMIFSEIYINEDTSNINLPLTGLTTDPAIIVHELRHYLNEPFPKKRNLDNDLLTEGLSYFDEFLFLDFAFQKLDKKDILKFKLTFLRKMTNMFRYCNFVFDGLKLMDQMGSITIENFKLLFPEKNIDNYLKDCRIFLSQHDDYKSLLIHRDYWHAFGTILASSMHQKYLKDANFLEKFHRLNERLKENKSLLQCLEEVDIDLTDGDSIELCLNEFKQEIDDLNKEIEKELQNGNSDYRTYGSRKN